MIDVDPLELAAIASSAYAEREADLQAKKTKVNQDQRELEESKAELAELEALEDRDAAIRIMDGDAAAPVDKVRLSRIENLKKRITCLTPTIPLQHERIANLKADMDKVREPYTTAVLTLLHNMQQPAIEAIQRMLCELEDPLSELMASDDIRKMTIGSKFALTHDREPPLSGRILAKSIIESLPKRWCPDELKLDNLNANVHRITAGILTKINTRKEA